MRQWTGPPHLFMHWLVTCSMLIITQCWFIANRTFKNKLQKKLNQNTNKFVQENTLRLQNIGHSVLVLMFLCRHVNRKPYNTPSEGNPANYVMCLVIFVSSQMTLKVNEFGVVERKKELRGILITWENTCMTYVYTFSPVSGWLI